MEIDKINESRIKELKKLINNANYAYYTLDKPSIDDSLYDSLYRELINIENEFPHLKTKDSPTNRLGGEISKKFKKVFHSIPLYSLDNAFNLEEVNDWISKVKKLIQDTNNKFIEKDFLVAELKIDGNAIALRYEDGFFVSGATRGDGIEGEEITNNIKRIKTIPLKLNIDKPPQWIEVRGEAFISSKSFLQINNVRTKNNEEVFANPRNACAGTLRQLNPKVVSERNLDFFAYQIHFPDDYSLKNNFDSHWERLNFLKKCGFNISKNSSLISNLASLKQYCEFWENERSKINFDTDGIVFKLNNISLQKKLGHTQKAPRWAIAFKFPAEEVSSKIKNLSFQVGRSGVITPVANFEPVHLAGTKVSRATLHNADRFQELSIHKDDTIVIRKAGEIIPEVVKVIRELRVYGSIKIKFPKVCPSCGQKLEKNINEAATRCTNQNCDAIQINLIQHWTSKSAMNIDGLGNKLVEQLFRSKLIKNISDLYTLDNVKLISLERMGEKSIKNLLDAIEKSKKRAWNKKLFALGINHIGLVTAKNISKVFKNINELKKATLNNPEELEKINGIGQEITDSLRKWFLNKENLNIIYNLNNLGVNFEDIKQETDLKYITNNPKLNKKTFVLTGAMKYYSRNKLIEEIESYGGVVKASINKTIDFLVVGEKAGSKLEKAQKLGIKILGEKDLKNLFK